MRKIMYLHGLESSNVCDKVDFMHERANVLAPSIDYNNPNIENELMDMVESFQPDLIIGSSMGGHAGLMLANYYNIDAIVFNPLITKEILDDALFYCDIEEVEDLGHRIPFYVFVDIYNKYVK
jgi:predicted esterase YcpF (UPF0227 family)